MYGNFPAYNVAIYNWWTRLVDWTSGLQDENEALQYNGEKEGRSRSHFSSYYIETALYYTRKPTLLPSARMCRGFQ